MTMGRRHLRGTTQIAANAAALKTFVTQGKRRNLFRKLRGGLQKPFANLSFSKRKALCLARFLIIPIKAQFILLNCNRTIITATKAFVKKEKTDGEISPSVFSVWLYEEILGITFYAAFAV